MGEAEDVVEVGGHASVLAVDDVERTDEIGRRDAHKGQDDRFLGIASATPIDVGIESIHQGLVGHVAEPEIADDRLTVHTEGEHQEGSSPPRSVLTLGAMPQDTTFVRRFYDEAQEGGVLELGELRPDERRVHVGRHLLHLGIEGVVDYMAVEFEERFFRDGFTGLLLGPHVDGGQQMVLCTGHRAVGLELSLAQRAEVEDAANTVLVLQALQVGIRRIMQMGGAQEAMRTYRASTGGGDASQVASVEYIIKDNVQVVGR